MLRRTRWIIFTRTSLPGLAIAALNAFIVLP
jgi:hypothetical protein